MTAAITTTGATMKLKVLMAGTAIAASMAAAQARATLLVVGTGWQYDQADTANTATIQSPWTFTVPSGKTYYFSLSDGFVAGDVYSIKINGSITLNSVFADFETNFVNNLGPAAVYFATPWTLSNYSHLQLQFDPGIYSIVIKEIHNKGLPAGVGVRLDAVPEPSTWAMMGLGFLGLAFAGYRGRRAVNTGLSLGANSNNMTLLSYRLVNNR